MNEWQLMNIRLQMEALISEREGMIAENQYRTICGNQIAYTEDSFHLNAEEFHKLIEVLRT
jgi:hypothetical protein